LRCALAKVTRWLRREGVRRGESGEPGTVTVMQRYGAAFNLNLHFHVLLLDGLNVADAEGAPRFRRARRWRQADVDALIVRIAARCEAWLARRGFGVEEKRDHVDDPDDALPLLQSASVAGRSAVRQRKARRVQRQGGREFTLPPLRAASEGYSLHAGVLIGARDAVSRAASPAIAFGNDSPGHFWSCSTMLTHHEVHRRSPRRAP
jgi:hypothetical protein